MNIPIVTTLSPLDLRFKSLWLENQVVGRLLVKVTLSGRHLLNLNILIEGEQIDDLIMIDIRRLLGVFVLLRAKRVLIWDFHQLGLIFHLLNLLTRNFLFFIFVIKVARAFLLR